VLVSSLRSEMLVDGACDLRLCFGCKPPSQVELASVLLLHCQLIAPLVDGI